jgi:hypothetical protein
MAAATAPRPRGSGFVPIELGVDIVLRFGLANSGIAPFEAMCRAQAAWRQSTVSWRTVSYSTVPPSTARGGHHLTSERHPLYLS